VTRSALALAALASAAIPGLDPATVEAVETRAGQEFELAFVQDTQHRRWVVRAPLTRAAGARMDVTVALLGLLARRLPFSVPAPKGFVALKEGGRAAVYPHLPGRPLELTHLPPGPGLAAEIGRSIAALHNVDLQLFEEAGLPAYDADTYRTRRLSELDRAAATGHVPTRLLARWEAALEDVSLWRFAPTPTHGDLGGEEILAVFEDDEDASSGRVRAFTGWEDAKVADPADDFATLVTEASPEAVDSVMEAYAHARVDRPDQHLERRARLAGELRLVTALLAATAAQDQRTIDSCASRLRRLDEHTAHYPLQEPQVVLSTAPVIPGVSMAPVVIEEWPAAEPERAPTTDVPHAEQHRGPDHPANPAQRPSAGDESPLGGPVAAAGTPQQPPDDEAEAAGSQGGGSGGRGAADTLDEAGSQGEAGSHGGADTRGEADSRGGATAIDHLPLGDGDEDPPAHPTDPAVPAGAVGTPTTTDDARGTPDLGSGNAAPGHDAAEDDVVGARPTGNAASRGGATAIGFDASEDEVDEDLTQPIPIQHPPHEQHP
jgi:macrolide phosphotransferase